MKCVNESKGKFWARVFVLLLLPSCASVVELPEKGAEEWVKGPQEGWRYVLQNFVTEDGKVDFVGLGANRSPLISFVESLGKVGPKTTPGAFLTRESKLGYYLNAFNALGLFSLLDAGPPSALNGLNRKRFLSLRQFHLDGEVVTLDELRDKVIRRFEEERVHFAMNYLVRGSPRLPRTPFPESRLMDELERQAVLFFQDPKNVEIDAKNRKVKLSEILEVYSEDFLSKSPTLIEYVNRYRMEKIPDHFEVEFLSFDWTINAK